jgi:arylsulfatase
MDPHYAAAWAWAGNTPFKWGKQVGSHLGGTRNPLVAHWPERIRDAGGLRPQFSHVIDIAPTILDIAGIPQPQTVDGIEQEPMHGSTFAASLTDERAPEHRTQQYFETIGNRGMYKDGWWLAMKTARIPWELSPEALAPYAPGTWDPDAEPAELYYLPDDFTQANDVAAAHPDKVAELKELFWEEAERYKVLPLLAALSTFFGILPPIPDDTKFEFYGDVQNVMPGMIPRIYNRSYSITADLVIPEHGAEGVIVANADHLGGFTLYVKDGKPCYCYNFMGLQRFTIAGTEAIPEGTHQARMEFAYDGGGLAKGGNVTLYLDGVKIGEGHVERTVPMVFSADETCDVGSDTGTQVTDDYTSEGGLFTGTINWVQIDLGGENADHLISADERIRVAMARQ